MRDKGQLTGDCCCVSAQQKLSLRQVELQRTFTFRNSKQTHTGIPLIAANMDTTGTFEMARVLSQVSRYSNGIVLSLFGPARHLHCMLRKTSVRRSFIQKIPWATV